MPDELDGTFAGREAIHFSVSAAGPPDGSPSCRDSRPFASIRGWSTASLLKPRQSTQSLTRIAALLSTLYSLLIARILSMSAAERFGQRPSLVYTIVIPFICLLPNHARISIKASL